MIDEKKLVNEFEEWHYSIEDSMSGDYAKAILKVAIGKVKGQPKVGEWIPVNERLPKTNGVYAVAKEGFGVCYVTCAYFDGSDTWHNDNRVNHGRPYAKDIVAWQPLPEPYNPESEG